MICAECRCHYAHAPDRVERLDLCGECYRKKKGRPAYPGGELTEFIAVKVTREQKEAFLEAAGKKRLSTWVRETLLEALD